MPSEDHGGLQQTVADNVRRRAGYLDFSRSDVARHLGVTPATISRKWLGGRAWSWGDIERLAEMFDVDVEYFVRRHEEGGQSVTRLTAVPSSYTVRDSNPEPIDYAYVQVAPMAA